MQLAEEDVCLWVYVRRCEGLLEGALDKWRCHMVRPDVLVSYVHSSSKTTTGATIGLLLSGRASQPICFLPARPNALWVLAISLTGEENLASAVTSALTLLYDSG